MTAMSTRPVPPELAARILARFEDQARRQAAVHRHDGFASYNEGWYQPCYWVAPTPVGDLEQALRDAGCLPDGPWTYPGLIGLPSLDARVDELLQDPTR